MFDSNEIPVLKGERGAEEELNTAPATFCNGNDNIDDKVFKSCDIKYKTNSREEMLNFALELAKKGYRVFPIHYIQKNGLCSCYNPNKPDKECDDEGKHPAWPARKGVKSATTDEETIREWWKKKPYNIAVACGKESGVVVVDIDGQEGKENLRKLDKNNELFDEDGNIIIDCPISKTGRNGFGRHLFLGYVAGLSNRTGFIKGVDLKTDGGYVIVPPSNHASGNKYEWINPIFSHEPQEMPEWLIKAILEKGGDDNLGEAARKNFGLSSDDIIGEGSRNSTLTSIAGSLRNKGFRFEEIKDSLLSINRNRCKPPLEERDVVIIAQSVSKYPTTHKFSDIARKGSRNFPELLSDSIEQVLVEDEQSRLIFDRSGSSHLWVKVNDHFEMLDLSEKDKSFKKFCFRLVKRLHGVSLQDDETFKRALLEIEVGLEDITEQKGFDLNPPDLGYRRAWHNGAAWYDLCTKDWTGIEIDENGYRKAPLPAIFLRRGSESPQVEPVYDAKPEEINRIFKYTNVRNENMRLLIKAWICASMVPRFRGVKRPLPILSFSGPTGSGKSVSAKILKNIIDPCEMVALIMPRTVDDLGVILNRNGLVVFDNIGKISQEISDTLCAAITEGFHSKRKLYTDNGETNLRLDSSIIFTSIGVDLKDDLINRTIFIETFGFGKDQKRKVELALDKEFKKDLPFILGGIFASISEALKIYSTLDDIDPGNGEIRMLDFAIFGEALSRVWGKKEMEFFRAYQQMQGIKAAEAVEKDSTIKTVVEYIKFNGSYYGPLEDLLKRVKNYAEENGIDTQYFSTHGSSFSRKLNSMDVNLTTMGISAVADETQTKGKTYYTIEYVGDVQGSCEGQTTIEVDDTQEVW